MNYLTTSKLWLRPYEAANQLNVSLKTIYRLSQEGAFVCAKIRGGLRIYSPSLVSYLHDQVQIYSIETGISLSNMDK
jgi:excisionase family DNA binding protein